MKQLIKRLHQWWWGAAYEPDWDLSRRLLSTQIIQAAITHGRMIVCDDLHEIIVQLADPMSETGAVVDIMHMERSL